MPLIALSADAAVSNRKSNAFANWPDRGSPNRVEPLAAPGFDAPFHFEPGEPIFTVGSCFARNVEADLARRGFEIPVSTVLSRPEFKQVDRGIINNYATPSIYNELAWAFGEREYVPDDHIIELMPGRFVDQHVSPSLRPEGRETVLTRRAAITDSYRSAAGCRTVIMTLGLSEAWYDKRAAYYLNVSPRPAAIKKEPERYELHVLSYEEIYSYLRDALLLLKKHCRPGLRVLLTVSPVPLSVTQRDQDVLVANTYSKSVLRTAAETAVTSLDFVAYFPSYESIILSDRKLAWLDDMVHVSDEIVRFNVSRMIEAFVPGEPRDDVASIAEGGELSAVERAKRARASGNGAAAAFFGTFADWSQRSVAFALEHARFLIDSGDAQRALAVLEPYSASDDTAVMSLRCEAFVFAGRAGEGLALLDKLGRKRVKSATLWDALLKAALAVNDPDVLISVLGLLTTHTPARAPTALMKVGRYFRERGEDERAINYYKSSLERQPQNLAILELADLLLCNRRVDEARRLLRGLTPNNAGETRRLERLIAVMGIANTSGTPSAVGDVQASVTGQKS